MNPKCLNFINPSFEVRIKVRQSFVSFHCVFYLFHALNMMKHDIYRNPLHTGTFFGSTKLHLRETAYLSPFMNKSCCACMKSIVNKITRTTQAQWYLRCWLMKISILITNYTVATSSHHTHTHTSFRRGDRHFRNWSLGRGWIA